MEVVYCDGCGYAVALMVDPEADEAEWDDDRYALECDCRTVPLSEKFLDGEPASLEGYLDSIDDWRMD